MKTFMKTKSEVLQMRRASCVLFAVLVFAVFGLGQSSDQNNPTPVTSNEVNGEISARDIGDSRLTTYYFIFTGDRGDVFMNVVTDNINGTIDIFTLNGLKPRTKITLFADNADSETGRIIYMRESENLILRIQGRTPNDDPGKFQIKFAGAFVARSGQTVNDSPRVGESVTGSVRVNSVGTIIEEPRGERLRTVSPSTEPIVSTSASVDTTVNPPNEPLPAARAAIPVSTDAMTPATAVVSSPPAAEPTKEITVGVNMTKPKRSALVSISREEVETDEGTVSDSVEVAAENPAEIEAGNEAEMTLEQRLANIQLRVSLKNGTIFVKPMSDVLSVNVIKGVLTIVTTEGKILEFSILDVIKMTIE